MNDPCQFLPWDSDFFDLRIARVNGNKLTIESVQQIIKWSQDNQIDCLYFLADPQDHQTIQLAEHHRFHLVNIRVAQTWTNHGTPIQLQPNHEIELRSYQPGDLPRLRQIAARIFTYTRFYADPCFARQKVNQFYDIWIKNSCEGYADQVLVADANHVPVGFITCHKRSPREGEIGLIGVGEQFRGRGIGKSLVKAALNWFLDQGAERVNIVTQGTNLPGLVVCQRVGFCTSSVQLWYHKWFNGCSINQAW